MQTASFGVGPAYAGTKTASFTGALSHLQSAPRRGFNRITLFAPPPVK
jgi:hypothetical protein